MTDESTIWVVAEPTVEVEPVPVEGQRSGAISLVVLHLLASLNPIASPFADL